MGDLEDKIRKLGMLSMVVGGIGALIGVVFFTLFEGASFLNDYIPFRGVLVYFWMLLMTVLAVPYVIAGAGLMRLRPWARPFGMILSTFGLLNVPLGTALGIYGLWVLMSEEADAVFSPRFER